MTPPLSTPPTLPTVPPTVYGGADTHADTIHVAVIDALGREIGDREFPTTPAGYQAAVEFLTGHGQVVMVGIEGTSSYGAGLTRAAQAAGMAVVEVNRPDRAHRRRRGKSDPIDAYQAAHAAASGRAHAAVKDEDIEAIRAVHNARNSAVKATTAAMNQIHQMLITAPVEVRERYRDLKQKALVKALAASRPGAPNSLLSPTARTVLGALRRLAVRHQFLTTQAGELETELRDLVETLNPGLLAAYGIGPATAAQLLITAGGNPDRLRNEASFAALCGVAPVPASSGKTTRHRLSRGGDRAANYALHTIALVRLASDPRTRQWATRQRAAGRTGLELLRILKRAIAREMYRHLTRPTAVPQITDLRPLRQSKNLTLTAAANHFGLWPAAISNLERGVRRDDDLAQTYREWLLTA
jgi:transposase